MNNKRTKNRQKLQSLLRELFQFDAADLDFGIYRILNQKRDDVEHFIEMDLLDAVAAGLAQYQQRDREELEVRMAELRQQLGPAIDESGAVKEEFQQMPIAQEYSKHYRNMQQLELAEETESRIFSDLITFFSRYYDNGDFLSKRRYSSRGPKYVVPYTGEEVLLHWANRDQYYVKTSEYLTDYRFMAGDATVWFRLEEASLPQDNVKGDARYFITRPEEPLAFDADTQTLTIYFEYRPLTEAEASKLLGIYNAAQSKSKRRKKLDRNVLCFALEQVILEELDDPTLKTRLAAVPQDKDRSLLGQHLNRYTARNTMDYFIHKDLGGFFQQELDFFLKNEVLYVDDVIGDRSAEALQLTLARMRVVRTIAEKIIAFLTQIEDFQKRLFEKKKFVVQTEYCLTLDRVPEAFYPEILANRAQLDAWRELYRLDRWPEDLFWRGDIEEAFLKNHPYLMVDTAFFNADFRARLLATFDDLDMTTDGLLLHSENFQALNLLQTKYSSLVKCIYIDPPYNTGEDEFLYKDNYQHSSWLTMMVDRLELGRHILANTGSIFVQIGDEEQAVLRLLIGQVFGEGNFRNTIIVRRGIKSVQSQFEDISALSTGHDKIILFSKRQETRFPKLFEVLPETEPGKWDTFWRGTDRRTMRYEIFGIKPDTGQWRWSEERAFKAKDNYEEYIAQFSQELSLDEYSLQNLSKTGEKLDFVRLSDDGVVQYYVPPRNYKLMSDVWMNVRTKGNVTDFVTEKHTELVARICDWAANEEEMVLDFFAGSGTTAHSIMELNREDGSNRKYILVEMGDYFGTVIKPRIQKVAFSANWKDSVPQDRDGQSHMFKYQRLESYEDALNNISVRQPEGAQRRLLHEEFDDYLLSYMLDFETQDSPTLLTQEAFEKPLAYRLLIQGGHQTPQPETVDLIETFHYLIGLHVRRQERHRHQERHYHVSRGDVVTSTGIEKVMVIWRDTEGLDLGQEADWANETLLTEPVDRIYVNGPSFIEGSEPLEITFRDRLEGGVRA